MVLIEGLGTDISPYRTTIRRLSQKYQVLAFDNRGVGRTDKPDAPYTIEMMAEDAADLLKSLRMAQTHVLGISMGGRIAMALALGHPELVRSLVLVSTSARVQRGTRNTRRFWLYKLIKRIRAGGRILGRSPQSYSAFLRQLEASGSYDCTNRLGEIVAPTLILQGKNDRLVPQHLTEELHAGIKNSKVIPFSGGHMFFIWENERFTDCVMDFLSGVSPAQSSLG